MPTKPRSKATVSKKIKTSVSSKATKNSGVSIAYRPTAEIQEAQKEAYAALDHMITQRNLKYRQFNCSEGDRTLVEFIDDSDKRLNGYTPTREEQDKAPWQANVFNPITRNKLKAIVASVALQVPQQNYEAVNKEGLFSARRAELIKQLVRHSRNLTNSQLDIFFEAWETAGKGTVVKYDGYLKTKQKRKFIKSFDMTTGEIAFDEREVIVDDRPIDVQVPLSEFFIWDFKIFDVQDQPEVAWVKNYNRSDVEIEFGHYPNFKYVKDKASIARFDTSINTYFYDSWQARVKDTDDYEVIRRYNKQDDLYEIWINGVEILRAPLLWGRKRKFYPFSKTIFEPFSDKAFFYGASLPALLQGNQDIDNVMWNSILDKMYRSLKPPMLVGLANKDLMDLEDELVDEDNKIYVPDINQVKPFPYNGVSNSEIAMLGVASRALDLQSVDAAGQGIAQKDVTARGILVADENARKLKGIFFMFLEDLWLQKTKLRIENVLTNYMTVKTEKIIGKDGAEAFQDVSTVLNVKNTEFSDGSKGTLGIKIVKNKNSLPNILDIEATENAMAEEGINYKMIAVTQDYLDEWEIDFTVTTDGVFGNDKLRRVADVEEFHGKMAEYYPERFVANKDKLFDELAEAYGKSPEDYAPAAPPAPEMMGPKGASPLDEAAAASNPLAI